jgi:outer membrane protein OmpA-like peptidoglycan-associated protein
MKLRLVLIFIGLLPFLTSASASQLRAESSNYVVIGAFASQKNALHFVENAKKEHFDASVDINSNRHLFYVYVLQTGNRQAAVDKAIKLRKETSFSDSWVFSGLLGENTVDNKGDIHPDTGQAVNPTSSDNKIVTTNLKEESLQQEPSESAKATEEKQPETNTATQNEAGAIHDGKTFLFKLFRSSDLEPVSGEVTLINVENLKKAATYKGNEDVLVSNVNNTGSVAIECDVFGYRKISQLVNLNALKATDGIVIENNKAVVPFELVRLKKGDISVMYNVFFYKDAAIMRPESRYEVTNLMQMMKESPNYEIRIHGHTNGSAAGKIIEPGESKNYFSLTGTKDGYGSAKKLSEERGNIIRDFLASEGIDPKRMQVKAWGGKKPIYDKHHSQAQTNVRVEIEIIKD